ncbi:uncharacterized protein LOC142591150 [Dermacentor variabilis]|uniref:uncharacterized protein LOC142591150 n=1 Tax=Dermacentor variabilis TaxID=34621 RepID=UPI003F5B4E8D
MVHLHTYITGRTVGFVVIIISFASDIAFSSNKSPVTTSTRPPTTTTSRPVLCTFGGRGYYANETLNLTMPCEQRRCNATTRNVTITRCPPPDPSCNQLSGMQPFPRCCPCFSALWYKQ